VTTSLTKRPVAADELQALAGRAFGAGRRAASWTELTGGTYNTVLALTLDDGRDVILKVAPPPHLELLTHEVDLLRTEVEFYRRAAAVGVAVPSVLAADFARDLIGTDFAFLSRIEGVPFDTVESTMTLAEAAAVRREVAAAAGRLHAVTGTAYGYPLRGSNSWQSTWRAAFGAMVDDLMGDAARLANVLPASPERIATMMRRHADVLDDVDCPALVHFDLWDGNVFVNAHPAGGWRLTGFIDGERAFYGDPIAELCSLTLFREIEPEILEGYAETAPSPFKLAGRAARRLDLYTTYLYLIMAIEGPTRGWHSPERREFELFLRGRLEEQFRRL